MKKKSYRTLKMNKFTLIGFSLLLMAVIAVLLVSCSEDDLSDPIELNKIDGAMSFKDYEEYSKTIAKLASMESSERIDWEHSKGFKSFLTASEEVYFSKQLEDFNSLEEIKEFAAENSEYVTLYEDEYGELVMEPAMVNDHSKYILNEEKVFFCKGLPYSSSEELESEVRQNTLKIKKSSSKISLKAASPTLKTASEEGGTSVTPPGIPIVKPLYCRTQTMWDQDIAGSDRTWVHIMFENSNGYDRDFFSNNYTFWRKSKVILEVRIYKKHFGIWIRVGRTINAGFRGDIYYKYGGELKKVTVNKEYNANGKGNTWREIVIDEESGSDKVFEGPYFGNGFYFWGDTPSTATAGYKTDC